MRAGWGGFNDTNAVGLSAAGVIASNLLSQGRGTLTLDGGVGFGTREDEVAGRNDAVKHAFLRSGVGALPPRPLSAV